MSSRTPEEKAAFKKSLLASGGAERPPPGARAAGLDRLLQAEAAKPAGVGPVVLRVTGVVIIAAVVASWLLRAPNAQVEQAPDAGVAVALVIADAAITEVPDAGVTVALVTTDAAIPELAVAPDPLPPDAGRTPTLRPATRPEDAADLLARELALLDAARSQLAPEPAKALTTLDDYSRQFPRGAMKTEAAMMRVETLLALGRRDAALKLARRIAASEPDGLVVRRLGQLLDGGL